MPVRLLALLSGDGGRGIWNLAFLDYMAIFDRFRKKAALKKSRSQKEKPPVAEVKEKKQRDVQETSSPRVSIRGSARAEAVLVAPHITEKASRLGEDNQYVFRVRDRATKTDVARAVEALYGVRPVGVQTIRIPRKRRRLGRTQGWRRGYKKAIVRFPPGKKIERMPH